MLQKFQISNLRVKGIKDQHIQSVELLNNIVDEFNADNLEFATHLMKELFYFNQYHFVCEENIMIKTAYANLETHRAEHKQFDSKFRKMVQSFEAHHIDFITVIPFIADWLINHFNNEDMALEKFLELQKQ